MLEYILHAGSRRWRGPVVRPASDRRNHSRAEGYSARFRVARQVGKTRPAARRRVYVEKERARHFGCLQRSCERRPRRFAPCTSRKDQPGGHCEPPEAMKTYTPDRPLRGPPPPSLYPPNTGGNRTAPFFFFSHP